LNDVKKLCSISSTKTREGQVKQVYSHFNSKTDNESFLFQNLMEFPATHTLTH